jgi:hypothetical protein
MNTEVVYKAVNSELCEKPSASHEQTCLIGQVLCQKLVPEDTRTAMFEAEVSKITHTRGKGGFTDIKPLDVTWMMFLFPHVCHLCM